MIECRWNVGWKLPLAKKEQGRGHAAHSEREKRRGDSLDPSPFPPIGFQVLHHILGHLIRSTRPSEGFFGTSAFSIAIEANAASGWKPLRIGRIRA